MDSQRQGDYMQKSDVDSSNSNVGEKILSLFLGVSSYRIVSVIKLKACAEKNSTYVQALQTELKYKDCKFIRNLCSSTSVLTSLLGTSTCKKKKNQRSKQGSRKKSKAIKSTCLKVINKHSNTKGSRL